MENKLTPAEKQVLSNFAVTGGRNAAVTVTPFDDFGMFMRDAHGRTVGWLHSCFGIKHGQWRLTETVYDPLGRGWTQTGNPMAMDDFGTLVEVAP